MYGNNWRKEKIDGRNVLYLSLSADQNNKEVVDLLARILIDECKIDASYLFQAIYRTKCALKIMEKTDNTSMF